MEKIMMKNKTELQRNPDVFLHHNKQVFLQYVEGIEGINPASLGEFRVTLNERDKQHGRIVIGTIEDNERVGVNLKTGLVESNEVKIRPHHDSDSGHTWIEGFSRSNTGEEVMLFERELQFGSSLFNEWPGLPIQLISDWVNGRYPYEKLQAVKTTLSRLKTTKLREIISGFRSLVEKEEESQEVTIMPQKDEFYEWLEIKSKVPNSPTGIYRVNREDEISSLEPWIGSAQQRFMDYYKGEKEIKDLLPIVSSITQFGTIIVGFKGRNPISLDMEESGAIRAGRTVILVPSSTEDGKLRFEVFYQKPRRQIASFVDKDENGFFWDEKFLQQEKERQEKKIKEIEQKIATWLTSGNKLTIESLRKDDQEALAADIRMYYPDGIQGLHEKFGLSPDTKKSTEAEANEYIRNLVYGKDEE